MVNYSTPLSVGSLRRTYQVAIGVAHPELAHVPGVVCDGPCALGSCLPGLLIDGLYIVYQQDDLNAAAALPRR